MTATSFDDIAFFVHGVQAGSFTATARLRGVPKSAPSRALSRLEAEVVIGRRPLAEPDLFRDRPQIEEERARA